MGIEDKIDIDVFKVVNRAIGKSDSLENMVNHLTQLLVGALEIKACTIFALNPDTNELEPLSSFGLSVDYMNKGPVLYNKSIGSTIVGEPIVIRDVAATNRLQYPQDAKTEGIQSIVSVPIVFYDKNIGALRLYHSEIWDISEQDLDSLLLLAENIGLAMMYSRVLNALLAVKETINDVHTVWLGS